MDEIRFVAGPVIQRYNDKQEEERQARLKIEEEAAAKRRAEAEAKKKAEEENKAKTADTDMKDAETVKPDAIEEPTSSK